MIKCPKEKWMLALGYYIQPGKFLGDAFYLISIPRSEKPDPNKWKTNPKRNFSKQQKPLRIRESPWPGPFAFSISSERNSQLTGEAELVCWMTTSNATTGTELMTPFLILLAGLIIMSIEVISSLSLNKPAFPALKEPDFSCTLCLLFMCCFY